MKHAGSFLVLALAAALAAAGCGGDLSTREKGTLGGAALGAATGAIIGAAVGSPGYGAAIGAGVGALGGAMVGGAMQESDRKAEAQPPQATASPGTPSQFAPVPGSPVYYAPSLPQNYFFYGGQYYLYQNGTWYYAPTNSSTWTGMTLGTVPPPILQVPVDYYKNPPANWKKGGPPPWSAMGG